MDKVNIKIGDKIISVEGKSPYWSNWKVKCNFHATSEKAFVDRIEKEFFIASIIFRDEWTIIKLQGPGPLENVKNAIEKIAKETLL